MHTYELLADEKDHVLFEHRPVVVTSPHFHNAVEFMFVEKGCVSVSVGGEQKVLHEGDACFCDSFCVHSYQETPTALTYVLVGGKESFKRFSDRKGELVPPKFFTFTDFPFLATLFSLYQADSENKNAVFDGIMQILLSKLSDCAPFSKREENKQNLLVCEILQYAETHLVEDLSLNALSNVFSLSKEHLSRILHKHLCENWKSYLGRKRIALAHTLLREAPNKNVLEIAYSCGFDSPNTFYRTYKKEYGKAPKE